MKKLFDSINNLNTLSTAIPGIIGGIALVVKLFNENPIITAITLFCIAAMAIFYSLYLYVKIRNRYRKPVNIIADNTGKYDAENAGAFIRGLRPFEKTDKLFGRETETRQLRVIIRALGYKFAIISGVAGSGKTSFLRSVALKEIEKSQMFPVYVENIGSDLIVSINLILLDTIQVRAQNRTIEENLTQLWIEKERKPIVLVIDQFEEFFIGQLDKNQRKEVIKQLTALLTSTKFKVRLLLGIRKEFVIDIHEFSPEIEQPTDINNTLNILNWEPTTALSVFKQMASADNVRFSEELINEIINDLSIQGTVRPVELQIVANSLLENRIYEYSHYVKANRASGILSNYIKEIINDSQTELEIQIKRIILKILCDENNDTKRAVDIDIESLQKMIWGTLKENKNQIIDEQFNPAFHKSLAKLIDRYIVKYERQTNRVNLMHDYLVNAILLSTADIETSEEKANRYLKRYLHEQESDNKSVIIPRNYYYFIKKNANPQLKSTQVAKKLLARSQRRIHLVNSIPFMAIVGILALFAIIFPPHTEYDILPLKTTGYMTIHDADSKIIISNEDSVSYVWNYTDDLKLLAKIKNKLYPPGYIVLNKKWILKIDYKSGEVNQYENINNSYLVKRGEIKIKEIDKTRKLIDRDNERLILFSETGNLYIINSENFNSCSKPYSVIPVYKPSKAELDSIKSTSGRFYPNYNIQFSYKNKYIIGSIITGKKGKNYTYTKFHINTDSLDQKQITLSNINSSYPNYCFSYNNDSVQYYTFKNKLYSIDYDALIKDEMEKGKLISNLYFNNDTISEILISKNKKWAITSTSGKAINATNLITHKTYELLNSTKKQPYYYNTIMLTNNHCLFFYDKDFYLICMDSIATATLPLKPFEKNIAWNLNFSPLGDCKLYQKDGLLYGNKMEDAIEYSKPLMRITGYSNEAYFCTDNKFLYYVSDNMLFFGDYTDGLQQINSSYMAGNISSITISNDSTSLLLNASNRYFKIERVRRFWGLTLSKLYWPKLQKEDRLNQYWY